MKTSKIMQRKLMGYEVRQNHKTEMLNANDLHKAGNGVREINGMTKKQMAAYFNLDSTNELIKEICVVDGIRLDEVKKSTRGKMGGTWVHPILFIDMAMWYSPELKVRILKWVQDGLLMARDSSGNSFKEMNSALTRAFPDEMDNPLRYREAQALDRASCPIHRFNGGGAHSWRVEHLLPEIP